MSMEVPWKVSLSLINAFLTIIYHHHTQCIPLIENYGQGLWREERRQLIPIEESAVKESLDSRKVLPLYICKWQMTTTNNTSLFDFTPFSPLMEWNYYLNNTQMTDFSPLDSSGSDDLQVSDFFSFQDYGHHEQQTMDFQHTQSFGCHGNEFFDIGGSSNIQNDGENSNRESIRNIKEKKGRIAFRMKSEMDVVDDGYKWRKYGKKMVKNSPNPRNYYRCAVDGCPVKKRVERDKDDMNYIITTYEANHNHQSQN